MNLETGLHTNFPYPRRKARRFVLQILSRIALPILVDLELQGTENLPRSGPLLVVSNHFSFVDPVFLVRALPWPIEFLGDFAMPNVPLLATLIPRLWGYYPVNQHPASRIGLKAAAAVLAQNGVLAIAPEGRLGEPELRTPQPGAAYLAARTGARLLPLGLVGTPAVMPALRNRRRAKVIVRIGQPIGPFHAPGHGRRRREALDKISTHMMREIAALLPEASRGPYRSS